jgi:hypothetical protein
MARTSEGFDAIFWPAGAAKIKKRQSATTEEWLARNPIEMKDLAWPKRTLTAVRYSTN